MPKIILVANSDFVIDINATIEEEDVIVRFNVPKSKTLVKTGGRTDYVFMANTVNLLQGRIRKRYHQSNILKGNVLLVFPYSDQLIQQINPYFQPKPLLPFLAAPQKQKNWDNTKYIKLFNAEGVKVQVLSENFYYQAQAVLNILDGHILSTGFIALFYFLHHPNYQSHDIYLNGFSFEGWVGHNWDVEKQYIHQLVQDGKVFLC